MGSAVVRRGRGMMRHRENKRICPVLCVCLFFAFLFFFYSNFGVLKTTTTTLSTQSMRAGLKQTLGLGQQRRSEEKKAMSIGEEEVVLRSWEMVLQAVEGARMSVMLGGEARMLAQERGPMLKRMISRLS